MTIKEVENLSGMTRANIRFYEAEGLIVPQRQANQYRDYSEEDLETLKRIKLLRSLQISLEEIKALQAGSRELAELLDCRMEGLQQERQALDGSREVCQAMRRDGARYETLEAQRYLDALESQAVQSRGSQGQAAPGRDAQSQIAQSRGSQSQAGLGGNAQNPNDQSAGWPVYFETDVVPEERFPWRRYFARSLDLQFYTLIWQALLLLLFRVNIVGRSPWGRLFDLVVEVLFMLALEPILLACFGTTPGKWIWGLAVTDCEGRRLTYEQARDRTRQVLRQGLGFCLPIYHLVRLWKSYQEKQDWEYRTEIILRDRKGWRIAAYIGCNLLMAAALLFFYRIAELPAHRGEITVEEFCENYNQLSRFYFGLDEGRALDTRGQWDGGDRFSFGGSENLAPALRFTKEDGLMTGMEFTVDLRGSGDWIAGYQKEMLLFILAYAGAQRKGIELVPETDGIVKTLSGDPFESFETSLYGVSIVCEVQYSGYYNMGTMLIPEENPRFFLRFSMRRQAALP